MGFKDMADPCEHFKQGLLGRVDVSKNEKVIAIIIGITIHCSDLPKRVKTLIDNLKSSYPVEYDYFIESFQEAERELDDETIPLRLLDWMKSLQPLEADDSTK